MRKVSDRTFLLHIGGKIEVHSKVPLRTRDDLSMAYTPGVGRVSLALAEHPEDVPRLTVKGNSVAVVTDGSAVLGLGNIGPGAALPVMEGKCALFKRFAGIDAWPICLDTQDTDRIVDVVEAIAPGLQIGHGVDAGEPLEQRGLALHHRQSGARSDVAQTEHGGAAVTTATLLPFIVNRGTSSGCSASARLSRPTPGVRPSRDRPGYAAAPSSGPRSCRRCAAGSAVGNLVHGDTRKIPGLATISSACSLSVAEQVTSTTRRSCRDSATSSAVTIPPPTRCGGHPAHHRRVGLGVQPHRDRVRRARRRPALPRLSAMQPSCPAREGYRRVASRGDEDPETRYVPVPQSAQAGAGDPTLTEPTSQTTRQIREARPSAS